MHNSENNGIKMFVFIGLALAFASGLFVFSPHTAHAVVPVHCPGDPCRTWDVALSGDIGPAGLGGILGGILPGGFGTRVDPRNAWFITKEAFPPSPFTQPFSTLTKSAIATAQTLFSWDSIVYFIVKEILHGFTDGIIKWIRTGQDPFFSGGTEGRLFVTNIDDFLFAAADDQASIFLREYFGPAWDSLCSPFRLPIGLDLSTSYGRDYGTFQFKAQCTITEIVENLEDFYADFRNGGWPAWFASGRYENNPFGLLTLAEEESRQRETRASRSNVLDFAAGLGFPGMRECIQAVHISGAIVDNPVMDSTNPDTSNLTCLKYRTNTPGKAVEDQLVDALGEEIRSLELADEINEIISALFEHLFAWLIGAGSGGSGLYGTEPTPTYVTPNPISEPTAPPPPPPPPGGGPGPGGGENCTNGIDDDGDGLIDSADTDCSGPPPPPPPPPPLGGGSAPGGENCTNGVDDDGDGLIDGNDPDCSVPPPPPPPIGF